MRKGGLREYPIPLKVNQPEILPAKGNYLRVRAALADLIIEIGDNDIYKMSAGEDVAYSVDEEFSQIRVTSLAGVDEIVNIQVGSNVRVTSSKLNGNVNVGAMPAVQIAPGQLVTEKPYEVNKSFIHADALAANIPLLVLDTALNVNGAYLLRLSASAVAAADFTMTAAMFEAPSTNFKYFAVGMHNGGSKTQMIDVDGPIYIPPGNGIAVVSTVATLAAASRVGAILRLL